MPHLVVNLSFTQVSSSRMELVLQYLSVHVFIMAHRTHKDTCFTKDAAFGEVTTEKARKTMLIFFKSLHFPFSACAWEECGTAQRPIAQVRHLL